MYRAAIVATVSFLLVFTSAGFAVQEKDKEKDKDKKEQKSKEPLDEKLRIGDFDLTIGEWIKKLRTHESPGHRRLALLALEASDTADKAGLPALLDAIEKDKDEQVRADAVTLLGKLPLKTRGAMKTLVGVLQSDKAGDVREAAALAIGGRFLGQAPDYLTPITDALKDEHTGTRIAVAAALRDLGAKAKPAFAALLTSLKNPKEDQQVRASAIHVLSRHDKENAESISLLVALLKNADTPMPLREAAADGLGRSDNESADVVNALCDTLSEKKLELRKAGAIALVGLGAKAKSGWPAIKARVAYEGKDHTPTESDAGIRNHMIRLTGTLAKTNSDAIASLTDAAVHDTSTENRIAAIQELGELPSLPQEARAALMQIATDDPRESIRETAKKALKRK
jgi:HEAT repeat protein